MMRIWSNIFNLIEFSNNSKNNPITIGELSKVTGLSTSTIHGYLSKILSLKLDSFWGLELYDSSDNLIYDLEGINNFQEVSVICWCDDEKIRHLAKLTKEEKHILEQQVMENSSHQQVVENKIMRKGYKSYDQAYKRNREKIFSLMDCILQEKFVNLTLKSNKVLFDFYPKNIVFQEETLQWYLEYIKKYKYGRISLDNIAYINESNYKNQRLTKVYQDLNNENRTTTVKCKVFHDKNGLELVIRIFLYKGLVNYQNYETYSLITLEVQDENLFLRDVRSFGPDLVILSPDKLRNRAIKEIEELCEVYNFK